MASWSSFDTFEDVIEKYMPAKGEGNTMASQIVTAVNKLIYKWFNDGDIYDNNYFLTGWCNDLSSYANWLYEYANVQELDEIKDCHTEEDYSDLLFRIAKKCLNEEFLSQYTESSTVNSIYEATGPFVFKEYEEDDDDDDYDEEDY